MLNFFYSINKVTWITMYLTYLFSICTILCISNICSVVFFLIQPEARTAGAMISWNLKLCMIKLAHHFDTGPLGKTCDMQSMVLMVLWAVIFPLRKVLAQLVIFLRRHQKDSLSKNMDESGPGSWCIINPCVFIKFWVVICADCSCLIFKDFSVYRLTPKSLHYTAARELHCSGTICMEVDLLLLSPLKDTRLFQNMYENGIAPLHFKQKHKPKTYDQTGKDAKIQKTSPISNSSHLLSIRVHPMCLLIYNVLYFLHKLKPLLLLLFSEYFSLLVTSLVLVLYFMLYTCWRLFYSYVEFDFLPFFHTFFYFVIYDNDLVLSIYLWYYGKTIFLQRQTKHLLSRNKTLSLIILWVSGYLSLSYNMHMHHSLYIFVFQIFSIIPGRCFHTIHLGRNHKIFNAVLLVERPGWDSMPIDKDYKAIACFILIGNSISFRLLYRFQHIGFRFKILTSFDVDSRTYTMMFWNRFEFHMISKVSGVKQNNQHYFKLIYVKFLTL